MDAPRLLEGQANPRTRLRGVPVIKRLMYRVALLQDGCWEWQGSRNPKGYGHIRLDNDGPLATVHRVSFEHFHGPVPDGREIDHLCGNRACVRPDHLEAITHAENVRRGRHNQNHGKTECIRGHGFSPENTSIDTLGKRACKTCARDRTRTYRARRAA